MKASSIIDRFRESIGAMARIRGTILNSIATMSLTKKCSLFLECDKLEKRYCVIMLSTSYLSKVIMVG